jgi:hypothetical protein
MVPHAYIFTRHVQSYLYIFRPSTDQLIYFLKKYRPIPMACHGRDHILVGFITTNAISAYHSFISGGNWSTLKKPQSCRKSLTNFIT